MRNIDMLEIEALKIRYSEVEAVADFSLSLGADEIVTLVGPTGCGKTSVLRAIAGLEAPSSGVVKIGDLRITRDHWVSPEKRGVGLVFQDFALFPHLNVAQNVGFRVKDSSEVDRWLELLGLESHRKAMPDTLSGGQKQRVALARALAHQPNIVLLDEPLSNLDLSLKLELRRQIRETLKAVGVAAVWVTHDQEEALSVGDRVGIMNAGRLEQIGPPEECYSAPATHFVASFLGDGIFLSGKMEDGCVHTVLGCSEASSSLSLGDGIACGDAVDVLVRPHDLSLEAVEPGNGQIQWCRFEGETRLYGVHLDDGPVLKVRVSHEQLMTEGERVDIRVAARHPLAILPQSRL